MLAGVALSSRNFAAGLQQNCFRRGLIVEFVGPEHDVMKLLPALTITHDEIESATGIIRNALEDTIHNMEGTAA